MLADKWPGQVSLSVLIVFGTFLPAGIPGATPRIWPEGPTRILDRGRVGHTVAHPAGQRSYRAEGAARAISVLDSRTGEVVKTIPTAFRVDLLGLSEDGRWLYGMSPRAEAIVVIDLVSDQVVGTIPIRPPAPPAPAPL